MLSEVVKWDLPTIQRANDILDMKADNETAFSEANKPDKKGSN